MPHEAEAVARIADAGQADVLGRKRLAGVHADHPLTGISADLVGLAKVVHNGAC